MPVYYYKAKTKQGNVINGNYEAKDKAEVIYMLREKDYFPLEIKVKVNGLTSLSLKRLFTKISLKDLAIFCRQFAIMVNAGIPILATLDILRKQTENVRLRETLNSVYEEVQKGKNLSEVMNKYKGVFPELLLSMIETGEISGTLDQVMDRMAAHYEKEFKIKEKIKNALIYPALIAIVAIFVIIFLITVVLPTFASMFVQMGLVLPLSTRVLITFSEFIKNNWLSIILIISLLLIGLRKYLKTENGRLAFDTLCLKIPVFGEVFKKVATARFARTLGALLASGIPLLEGIAATKKVVENRLIRKGLTKVEEGIKRGKALSEQLNEIKAFPLMLIHMVKIGEDTGTLDFILEKTADFFDDEVDSSMTKMTTLLEPVIIVLMAVVVAFIVISIVIPMFDMMTNINF